MREILEEEKGSSVIVAALLLLAIFSVAYGAYVSSTVPQKFANKEKNQMNKVQNRFTDIQKKIQNMSEDETKIISIPMSVDLSSTYLEGPSIAGSLALKTYFEKSDAWRTLEYVDSADTSAGDVWFGPENGIISLDRNYSDKIYANSNDNRISYYKFVIAYNENILEVNTSLGENGVEAGKNGFLSSVNAEKTGKIIIEGSSTFGTGPGDNLHLLNIHWKTVGTGNTNLNLEVENLKSPEGYKIGTPNGINGKRIVPIIYEDQGIISFNKQNGYYVDQKYVYEYGAVILVQGESSQILSEPIFLKTEKLDDNKLEVEIQKINLLGSSAEIFSTGTASVSLTKKNTFTREGVADNLLIKINPEYPQAWGNYLEKENESLHRENIEAELNQNQENLSLTIKGIKGSSSKNNDIIYTIKYQEIQAVIS